MNKCYGEVTLRLEDGVRRNKCYDAVNMRMEGGVGGDKCCGLI